MPVLHHNVALLRVADPGVIEEIRAVLPLDAYVVGWISPTEAVLDPAELKTLLEALEARGLGALVRRPGAEP
jgi:glycine/D-amino acid oxidase-like deaminating enzyme